MSKNRRKSRCLVLALLLIALLGPWGQGGYSHGPSWRMYFPDIVEAVLAEPLHWTSLLVAIMGMAPIACLAAILAPSSRAVVAYRTIAAAITIAFCAAVPSAGPESEDVVGQWGLLLHALALLLGTILELVPARGLPKRDYAEVFR